MLYQIQPSRSVRRIRDYHEIIVPDASNGTIELGKLRGEMLLKSHIGLIVLSFSFEDYLIFSEC